MRAWWLLAANRRSMTRDTGIFLGRVLFQRHLIEDRHAHTGLHRNGRGRCMTRRAGYNLNIGFRDVQDRHLRDVDVAGCAPEIVVVCFGLAVFRAAMRIVPKFE